MSSKMTKVVLESEEKLQSSTLFDDSDTELLFCQQERLDQNSPELWPEQIPGVTEFTASSLLNSPLKPVLDTVSSIILFHITLYSKTPFICFDSHYFKISLVFSLEKITWRRLKEWRRKILMYVGVGSHISLWNIFKIFDERNVWSNVSNRPAGVLQSNDLSWDDRWHLRNRCQIAVNLNHF